MKAALALIVALFVAAGQFSYAAEPWTLDPGSAESCAEIMARQRQADARPRTAQAAPERLHRPRREPRSPVLPSTLSPFLPLLPVHPIAPASTSPRAAQSVAFSFMAVDRRVANARPPDSMGAVGPSQIMVCVNGRFRLFGKNGTLDPALDVDSDVFFASVMGKGVTTDPRVRFDRHSGRWFISMITEATVNRVLLAVSSGPVVSSSSSFTFFQFQNDFGTVKSEPGHNGFADYDTLGIDAHALYVGVSIFAEGNGPLRGATGFVIRKSDLLLGKLSVTPFRQLSTNGLPGIYTPQGVDNDDPNSTEGYFLGVDNLAPDKLVLIRVADPGGSPSVSASIDIAIPNTGSGSLGAIPALGSVRPIDDNDNRLFQASMRNGSLYTAHNLEVDSKGVAFKGGGRDGARWYEIVNLAGTPGVNQSGTLFDPAESNPASFTFPTCAVSGQGHMALGATTAGNSLRLSAVVAGRLAGDPLGTLQAPTIVAAGVADYNAELTGTQRWGDYSHTVVDPNDNMTFWTFQEFCVASSDWAVQAIQLKAPPPARAVSCAPPALPANGTHIQIAVTGESLNGSGFYDPGVGFPNHLQAAFSGGGVIVNSVQYLDPLHVMLDVSLLNAAAGPRVLTVTNPDGQSSESAPQVLCVSSGAPVLSGISINGPLSAPQGGSFAISVSGVDVCGVPLSAYRGRVHFSSSDPRAALPSDYTFVPADNGSRMFMLKLSKFGDVSVSVNDRASGLSGSLLVNVSTGPALTVRPNARPNPGVAGLPVNFSVSATSAKTTPSTYTWDFGDGSPVVAAQFPTYTYQAAGNYDVNVSIDDGSGGRALAGFVEAVTPPPAFISPPSAVPNPAGVNQPVQFMGAAFETGNDTLSYTWTFGDGSVGTGAAPSHRFAVAGSYTATVAVGDTRGGGIQSSVAIKINAPVVGIGNDSDGDGFSDDFETAFGSDPNNPLSTPLNGQTAASSQQLLNVQELATRLNFIRKGNDSIQMRGLVALQSGFVPAGSKLAVDIAGVDRVFLLDAHGRAKGGFDLQLKTTKGAVNAQAAAFTLSLKRGDFTALLARSGLSNSEVKSRPLALNVALVFNGTVYQATVPQIYKAHAGRNGGSK